MVDLSLEGNEVEGGATLELVTSPLIGEPMQEELEHRELVEVCLQERDDDTDHVFLRWGWSEYRKMSRFVNVYEKGVEFDPIKRRVLFFFKIYIKSTVV